MKPQRIEVKQLGELLLERGIITNEQLKKALEVQKTDGGLLGEVLIELGFAKEEDIAQVLTAQYGFPYLPLSNYEINQEILSVIPSDIARKHLLIAIDKTGNNLTVAMANPLNLQAIEDIKLISNCSVQIFVATVSDIKSAIQRYYKDKP